MSGITIKVDGAQSIIYKLDGLASAAKPKANEAIHKAVDGTYDDSQASVAVLTGELKASGAKEYGDLKGSVSYGTDHCWYVELGTIHMAAQPYLFPAFAKHKDQLLEDLKALF